MLRCADLLGGAALTILPCLWLSQQLDTAPGHLQPLQSVRAAHTWVCSTDTARWATAKQLLWWVWVPVFATGTCSRHPRVVSEVWSWGRTVCLLQWLLLCDLSAILALSSSLASLAEHSPLPRCLPTSLILCSLSCSLPSSSFVSQPNDLTLHSLLGGVGCERGRQQRRRSDIKSS